MAILFSSFLFNIVNEKITVELRTVLRVVRQD